MNEVRIVKGYESSTARFFAYGVYTGGATKIGFGDTEQEAAEKLAFMMLQKLDDIYKVVREGYKEEK